MYPSFKPKGATREYIGVGAPIFSGHPERRRGGAGTTAGRRQQRLEEHHRPGGRGLAVGLAVALILATYVARRITHPLRVIGSAADKVARGDLDVNVVGKRNSDDELGQLATRFQGMVDRLREVDELERNFLMRVTHELRTPLTAISGHVQAVDRGRRRPGRARRVARGRERGGAPARPARRRPARPHPPRGAPVPGGARGGRPRGAARAGRRGVPREGPRRRHRFRDADRRRSDGHHRRRPRPSDREQPPRQRLPVDAARRARSSWAA